MFEGSEYRKRPDRVGRPMHDDARLRLTGWVAREPHIGRLVDRLTDGHWQDDVKYRLDPEARAALKAEIIRRVEAAGGEVRLTHVVLKVTDRALRTELPS